MREITPKQAKHMTAYLMETWTKSATKYDDGYHELYNVYVIYLNNKTKRVWTENELSFREQDFHWITKTKYRSIRSKELNYRTEMAKHPSLIGDFDVKFTKLGSMA